MGQGQNRDSAAAVAERPESPSVVLSLADLKGDYMDDPVVDVDSMPSVFEDAGAFKHPVILGIGKSLAEVNDKKFYYAWMDKESASRPKYQGFRPVTRACAAAFAPGGETLDESQWMGQNVVKKGTMVYHFCKWSYFTGMKEAPRKRAELIVKAWDQGKREDVGEGGFVTSNPQKTSKLK